MIGWFVMSVLVSRGGSRTFFCRLGLGVGVLSLHK